MKSNSTPCLMESASKNSFTHRLKSTEFSLIAAMTKDYGIGFNNDLPWSKSTPLNLDLQYFNFITKKTFPSNRTIQKKDLDLVYSQSQDFQLNSLKENELNAIIMGRKTWESLPSKTRPFKNVLTIVVTKSEGYIAKGSLIACSLDEALELSKQNNTSYTYVVGGSNLYRESIQNTNCKYLFITQLIEHPEYPIDTKFPNFTKTEYRKINITDYFVTEFISQNFLRFRSKIEYETLKDHNDCITDIIESGVRYQFLVYERIEK